MVRLESFYFSTKLQMLAKMIHSLQMLYEYQIILRGKKVGMAANAFQT